MKYHRERDRKYRTPHREDEKRGENVWLRPVSIIAARK